MDTKSSAKDFFLHIATIGLLYAGTIALLNILFRVINVAYPQVNQFGVPSISFPVATLIVVFPLFLFLSNMIRKSYAEDLSKKDYPVRKWLIYITLFIAGGVLAGDLVVLIYYFLDGRELTAGFFLKFLSVLVVAGSIFGYFIDDLKDRLTNSRRNIWRVVSLVLVLGSIVLGFSVLGTPQNQREIRYDSQRISDLQGIQWQIVNYWQQKEELPESLDDLDDPISSFMIPTDPQTGEEYEYTKTGNLSFELCAEFNRASQGGGVIQPRIEFPEVGRFGDNWEHEAGRECFLRTIDPDLYPVRKI